MTTFSTPERQCSTTLERASFNLKAAIDFLLRRTTGLASQMDPDRALKEIETAQARLDELRDIVIAAYNTKHGIVPKAKRVAKPRIVANDVVRAA
jgi:hypothetical protein